MKVGYRRRSERSMRRNRKCGGSLTVLGEVFTGGDEGLEVTETPGRSQSMRSNWR